MTDPTFSSKSQVFRVPFVGPGGAVAASPSDAGPPEFASRSMIFQVQGTGGAVAASPSGTGPLEFASRSQVFMVLPSGEIECACGLFVAVGRTGALATSPTGTAWTLQTSGFGASDIEGVAWGPAPGYANGLFVAVGASGKLFISEDAETWDVQTSSFGGTTITHVVWSDELGFFLAVGETGKAATGVDVTWTQQTTGFSSDNIYAAEWSPELTLFVIGGTNGTLATSPDGVTWTLRTSNNGVNNIGVVAWSPALGLFVVGSAGGMLTTSPDGITWTQRTSGFGAFDGIEAAVWSPDLGLFVIAGGAGSLATSPDGITWTARTSTFGSSAIFSALWSDELGLFLIGGEAGKFATSPDGITWTARTSGFSTNMTAIARSTCFLDTYSRVVAQADQPDLGLTALSGYSYTWQGGDSSGSTGIDNGYLRFTGPAAGDGFTEHSVVIGDGFLITELGWHNKSEIRFRTSAIMANEAADATQLSFAVIGTGEYGFEIMFDSVVGYARLNGGSGAVTAVAAPEPNRIDKTDWVADEWYIARFVADGPDIRVKLWLATDPVPADYQLADDASFPWDPVDGGEIILTVEMDTGSGDTVHDHTLDLDYIKLMGCPEE